MNKTLTMSKSLATCCVKQESINSLKYNFDYILDSDNKILKTKLVFKIIKKLRSKLKGA